MSKEQRMPSKLVFGSQEYNSVSLNKDDGVWSWTMRGVDNNLSITKLKGGNFASFDEALVNFLDKVKGE